MKSDKYILVVDDHSPDLTLISQMVSTAGYQVIKAQNAYEALAALLFRTKQIGLVITDLLMPDIDGFDLTKRIKRSPELCHIPVILVSALGYRLQEIETIYRHTKGSTGVDGFLPKPLEYNNLVSSISMFMDHEPNPDCK